MKLIYVLLVTTTTIFDGHPHTRGVGVYETEAKCYVAMEQLVNRYKQTFPEGVVSIRSTQCDMLEVPDNYKWKNKK